MYLCYIDESGTSDIPGNTSHFVLTGISIPVNYWKSCDRSIEDIKRKYNLSNTEIHVGWILRPYIEQKRITQFDKLSFTQRRAQVEQLRKVELLRLQKENKPKLYKQTKKNYIKTSPYIHLSYSERKQFIKEIATCVSQWGFARLFISSLAFSISASRLPGLAS